MIRNAFIAVCVTIVAAATATTADAQSRVRAGLLTCTGAGGPSFIVGSVHNYTCLFRPEMGRRDRYRATIRRFGVDLGFTGRESIAWVVFAPTRRLGPGALAGSYGGVSGSASVGVGVGANVLVGGSKDTISLQPVSSQVQRGLNVAAGISRLELRPR